MPPSFNRAGRRPAFGKTQGGISATGADAPDFCFSRKNFGLCQISVSGCVRLVRYLELVFAITMTFAPSDNTDEAAPPAPEGFVDQKQRSGLK